MRFIRDHIIELIAGVIRASDAIVDGWGEPSLTVEQGITALCTIAEQPVAAERVVWGMNDPSLHFAATVDGAAHAVVCVDRLSLLTAIHRVTGLLTVAEETIRATSVIREVFDEVGLFIALIQRAADAVRYVRRDTRSTAIDWMAGLSAIAKLPV